MNNEMLYWIWLSQIKEIGCNTARRLIVRYGSPENIYEISKNSPELLKELNVRQIASVRCSGDLQDAQKLLEECYKKKIKIMTMNEAIYPKLARNINDMPILFYYRGNAGLNKYQRSAGVIGARRCIREAKEKAIKVAEELVVRKIPVISGMAKGIDSYAHTAALKNGGFTVAVLGHGLAYCYPPEHSFLMERIGEEGLLLSEYPPNTMPQRYCFPKRNRIIAALSTELYVIGCGNKSGTSSTVEYSRKYGRNVYLMETTPISVD